MADQWYCRIAGEQSGPFSAAQLRAMVAEGRLSPADSVRFGPSGAWVFARDVKGLFSPGAARTPAAPEDMAGGSQRPIARPLVRAKPVGRPTEEELRAQRTLAAGPSAGASGPTASEGPMAPPPAGPGQSASGDTLHFLEEQYTATPAGPLSAPAAGRDPFSGLQNPKFLVWVLVGLLGLLAVLMVMLLFFSGQARQLRESRARELASRAAAEARDQAATNASAQPAQSQQDVAAATAAPEPDLAESPPEEPKQPAPVQWLDASKDSWIGGDVTLRVLGVEIARPKIVVAGQVIYPIESCLVVKLELTNRSTLKAIPHSGWGPASSPAVLANTFVADSSGRPYYLKHFGGGMPVEGQVHKPATIAPGGSLQDVLVFPLPTDASGSLRLSLSARPFQDPGTAHLEIPRSMIRIAPPPKIARPPVAAAKGAGKSVLGKPGDELDIRPTGDPSLDFGIPEGPDDPLMPSAGAGEALEGPGTGRGAKPHAGQGPAGPPGR
ncbi:MAG: GYF domain-containing protein [Thermoguttaceae bacterium]